MRPRGSLICERERERGFAHIHGAHVLATAVVHAAVAVIHIAVAHGGVVHMVVVVHEGRVSDCRRSRWRWVGLRGRVFVIDQSGQASSFGTAIRGLEKDIVGWIEKRIETGDDGPQKMQEGGKAGEGEMNRYGRDEWQ